MVHLHYPIKVYTPFTLEVKPESLALSLRALAQLVKVQTLSGGDCFTL